MAQLRQDLRICVLLAGEKAGLGVHRPGIGAELLTAESPSTSDWAFLRPMFLTSPMFGFQDS